MLIAGHHRHLAGKPRGAEWLERLSRMVEAGALRVPVQTDQLDLADEFQRTWYIRQVLEHGLAEDIAHLDLGEVARVLPELNLPLYLHSLWARLLESRHCDKEDPR